MRRKSKIKNETNEDNFALLEITNENVGKQLSKDEVVPFVFKLPQLLNRIKVELSSDLKSQTWLTPMGEAPGPDKCWTQFLKSRAWSDPKGP